MKNILLVDDHPIVTTAIREIIMQNFSINRIDSTGNESMIKEFVKKVRYDLIILDINMPSSSFTNTLEWLCTLSPSTNILIFTMYEERFYGLPCMNSGAKGFLHKNCTNDEIIAAIRATLDGRPYVSPALAELLINAKDPLTVLNPFSKLSSRELEIAVFLSRGVPLPNICTALNIQYSTGNTYKRRILEKLNVETILSMSRLMISFNIPGN